MLMEEDIREYDCCQAPEYIECKTSPHLIPTIESHLQYLGKGRGDGGYGKQYQRCCIGEGFSVEQHDKGRQNPRDYGENSGNAANEGDIAHQSVSECPTVCDT